MSKQKTTPEQEAEQRPLSRSEFALLAMEARSGHDGLLVELAHNAELGLGAVVGLLVNGMVVIGALGSGRDMAEKIDEQVVRVVDSAAAKAEGEESAEGWRRLRSQVDGAVTGRVDRLKEFTDETQQLTEERIDELGQGEDPVRVLPGDLAERLLAVSSRTSLTLRNAAIVVPGSPPQRVDPLRVRLDQVTGWWLVPTDENGSASISLFSG